MTNHNLIVAAIAAGVLAITTAVLAAPACSNLMSGPNGTLRRCIAATGESYCELCKDGRCVRTSCARPAIGGTP
jgi:hypothetical protein